MVEEQFKLGLTVEIEQEGLPELRKMIEKEVQQAMSVSSGKIAKGIAGKGAPTRAAPGVSTGAIKSAADAVSVSAKELGKKIVALASSLSKLEASSDTNATTIKAAADKIDAAIKKLIGALDGKRAVAGGAGGAGPAAGGGRGGGGAGGDGAESKRLKTARRNLAKSLEASMAREDAVSQNLVKFDVNLEQDIRELAGLESALVESRKAVKSFQSKLKASEKEIETTKGEKRGTKTLEKKLGQDKGRVAAAKAEEKSLRASVATRKQQIEAVKGLVGAAEGYNQSLRAAREAASALTTSSKTTAGQLESAGSALKQTTGDMSNISAAADKLAKEINTESGAHTDLAKKVRATAQNLEGRKKVLADEISSRQKVRKEKQAEAAATRKARQAQEANAAATKKDTEQKKKSAQAEKKGEQKQREVVKAEAELASATEELADARRDSAKRTQKITKEGKVGTGAVAPGIEKRRADKAKAREKTSQDTELAAKGTGKNLAIRKQVASEEARRPQQLTESKGPGGRAKTGDPKVDKAQSTAERYLSGQEVGVARINKAMDVFEKRVQNIFPNRQNIMQELGLDFRAEKTEGGSVGVKDRSGQLRTMQGTVEIFDSEVKHVGDVLSDLLTKLSGTQQGEGGLEPSSAKMREIVSTSRYREDFAVDRLKGAVQKGVKDMPVLPKGTVGAGLQQGGRVQATVKLTKEQSEHVSGLKNQRDALLYLNKVVGEVTKGLELLTAAGYDTRLSSIGLSEGSAPKITGFEKGKMVPELGAPLQARALADLGVGGAAFMKEQRAVPSLISGKMIGGERPSFVSKTEKGLYDAGLLAEESGKDLVTAVVSMPEAMEDQIPILRSTAEKLGTKAYKTSTVGELGPGIKEGAKLTQDQLIGQLGEEKVQFDIGPAISAKVSEIRKIMIAGVERYKVEIETIAMEGLGGKGQLGGGLKGKLVPYENLGKTESGQDIEMIISPESFAGRGDVRDPTYMMANSLSEFTKGEFSPQQVGDALVKEMGEAGTTARKSLNEAIQIFTKREGIKGFTGTQKITGGLIGRGAGAGGIEAVTGKAHLRLAQGQLKGGAAGKARFWSATDQASMEMAGMGEQAEQTKESMARLQYKNNDLIQSIIVLTSDYEQQSALLDKEGIQPVMPTKFTALPAGAQASEEAFEGTLIDPKSAQAGATAMLLPRMGGKHGALRMGPVGEELGARKSFSPTEGEVGADKLSRQLDKIRETSTAWMVRRGEVDIAETPETVREGAAMGDEAINAFAKSIGSRLSEDPTDAGALKEFDTFTQQFKPLISGISDVGKYIKYREGGKVKERTGTGEEYVAGRDVGQNIAERKRNQILATRDLLFRRTGGGAKSPNVPGQGKLYESENVEELREALGLLGVTFGETGKRVKQLQTRLYGAYGENKAGERVKVSSGLVGEYQGILAAQTAGRNKPDDPMRRTLMQQLGGGQSYGMRGRAFAIPGDVGPELKAAQQALERLGQTGTDVGKALSAAGEMEKLQTEDVLPQDAILVNRKDFDKWVQELARFEGEDPTTVKKRLLERDVMLHRDPTTGGVSMQKRKLMIDEGERVARGEVAVGGTFREGPGQIKAILGPLEKERGRLGKTLEARGGEGGSEIEKIRGDYVKLDGVIQGLINSFSSLVQNLDFDGDEIGIHGNVVQRAARQEVAAAAQSNRSWQVLNQVMNKMSGTVRGTTLGSMEKTFGAKAKGVPEEFRSMAPVPQTEEQRQSNVSGLVSGKMLVGQATEVHSRLLMALMAGVDAQDWSGAFKAVLGRLMMNINETLKMKHTGGQGEFEPGALIDRIRKGDAQGLSEGMKKGGQFEKLGEFNKEFLARRKKDLLGQSPAELTKTLGEEGMGDIVPKEGITAKNYKGIINKALKKMDMKSVFKEMQQMLIQGYAKSLEESGKSKSQIKAKIKEKLKGKGGREPAGIPLEEVIGTKAKPWLATRGKFTDKMKKIKPLGQLKELMSFLPKELVQTVAETMDLDVVDIDRESLLKATGIQEWAGSLRESVMGVRGRLGDQMEGAKLPKGVGGRVKEGKIQLASQVMQDMNEGMEALAQIESGKLEINSERAQTSIKKLSKALGFIGHERVHQLGAGKGGATVRAVAGSLVNPRGTLGKQREEIQARMEENLPNVRRLAKRKAEFEAKAEEDPTKQRRAKIAGKEERGTAAEIAQKLGGQLNTLIAEELLAYLAQGRLEDAIGDLKLGKSLEFLENRLKELSKKDKEIFAIAQVAGERMSSSTLEGLMAGVEGGAVDRGGIEGRVASRGMGVPVPGEGLLTESRNKLAGLERVLQAASVQGAFGIGAFDEEALKGGKVSLTGGRELRGRTIEETEDVKRANELIKKAKTEPITGEEEKELKATAKLFKRDDDDAHGWKMYQDAMRQFQAAKTSYLINQARQVERELEMLFEGGKGESQRARDLGPELQKKVAEVQKFLLKTTQNIAVPNLAQVPGMGPTTAAIEAGVVDLGQAFEAPIISRRGKKDSREAKDFEKTEEVLWGMHAATEKNIDAGKQLAAVWEHVKEDPKIATERLTKMADVTKYWAQTFRQAGLPAAADNMARMSKETRQMATAMGTMAQPSKAGMQARLPKALKQKIYGQGPGEGGLAMPVTEQYAEFEGRTKAHQKKLQGLIESGQFKKMGAGTDFEPMKAQIIDPETNQVIQNMEAQFTKTGKRIEVSMKQAGVATQRFGRRMKDAFRRVVQWGFATGIVYGTMRAFRSLSTVLTDVQDRIFALKKVMDVTITDFGKLQDSAVGMAKNYGIAINEVLDGMVVYGQQGLKVNEIMERTKATLLAVNVTTLDSKGATEALTAAHKIFGGEISNSMGFVDAWAKVAAKHAITAKDLADVVKKAGAAAGIAGMNFQDFMGITTAIGVVSRQTGKEIGTSLKFMMRGMRRPVAQKEFAGMGIASLTKTGELRPAMDILVELANKWHDLSRAQQLAAAQAAAGIRHYNSFIILMNNFDEALTASADAASSQGFAFRKNALAMETLSKQMSVMRESVKGLGLELGKAIIPTVTGAIKALSVLVDVVSKIPGPMLQIGTLGLAGMLAFHKAADMIVDSLDAMMGYGNEGPRLKKFFGAEGYVGGMGKGIKKAVKGVFGGLGAYTDTILTGKLGKKSAGIFDPKQAGLIVRGLDGMRAGVVRLAVSMGVLKSVMSVGIFALVAVAGWQLVKLYKEATKTGQDMADEMFDQVGQSQDLADAYRSQSTELDRISLAQRKLASAKKLASDLPATQKAIVAGEFRGAALAARDLAVTTEAVGKAIAKIDPTSITDITDAGDFVYDISDGFQALTDNIIDAQNAITMAMQTDVIKAYANEIVKAKGFWDNFSQAINSFFGFDIDFSPAGKLETSKKLIQELATERNRLTEAGIDTLEVEERHINALAKHLDLQDEIGQSAIKLKEVLDQLPAFENLETLTSMLGPDLWKSLEGGALSGKFGRGATASSIMFDMVTKSAGVGTLTEPSTAANPAWLIESLMQNQGIKPEVFSGPGAGAGASMPRASGEIMVVSRQIAEAILKETTTAFDSYTPEEQNRAATAMQNMVSYLDEASGKMVWQWGNSLMRTFDSVSAVTVDSIISTVGASEAKILIFRRKSMEAAVAATKRLLTMQFTGAMAGIRDPGTFNIGPGTRRELTAEQRVMESLPVTLQRMVDLQKEMTEINRQYNEQLGEGNVQEASAQMAKSAGAVKVMDDNLKELVMTLQREGFEISKALHYNMAIQNLNKTLEEAAFVAEEAASAEERRTQFVKHLSGALAGMPELPSLTFGKGKKDLTGLERLQSKMPGLAKIVKGFDQLTKKRESMLGVLTDVDKKKATFVRAMDNLISSGEKLSNEQVQARARELAKGMSAGDIKIVDSIKEAAMSQDDHMKSQTDILSSILDVLTLPLRMEDMSIQEKAKATRDAVNAADTSQVATMMRTLPPGVHRAAFGAATGMQYVPPARREKSGDIFKIRKQEEGGSLGLTGKELEKFNYLVKRLVEIKTEQIEGPGAAGMSGLGISGLASHREFLQDQEESITRALMEISGVRAVYQKEAKKQLNAYIGANRTQRIENELSKADQRLQTAQVETAKQQMLASKYFNSTQKELVSQLNDANAALLSAAPHLRLSAAAQDLAKSLEDLIDDFKKAEALALDPEMVKSDLEGPFARVGKPGFKTDFEIREAEARKKLTSRDSSERKSAQEELVKIEFDVKNAKLKQQQDKEVQELKRQQSQAEKFRETLYQALQSGEYAGEEIEGRIKGFFNVLTDELETAEQATMRGGELYFEGVPSLQGIKPLIAELDKYSEAKANLAMYQVTKKAFEDGGMKQVQANTNHLSSLADKDSQSLGEQTNHLRDILAIMQNTDLSAAMAEAFGTVSEELGRLREEQRKEMEARPRSATATLPETAQKLSKIQGMENRGEITPGNAEKRKALAAASGGGLMAMAAAIARPVDELVTSIYKFSDGMHAVVTEVGGPGGKVVGSQTFAIKKGIIEMGDNVIVNPGRQGGGIGQRQLEEVMRFSKQQGLGGLESSRTSLALGQATSYQRAGRSTGARVLAANPATEVMQYPDPATGRMGYRPREGFEGPIVRVLTDKVAEGTKIGTIEGNQELLHALEERYDIIQGQRARGPAAQAAAEALTDSRVADARRARTRPGTGAMERLAIARPELRGAAAEDVGPLSGMMDQIEAEGGGRLMETPSERLERARFAIEQEAMDEKAFDRLRRKDSLSRRSRYAPAPGEGPLPEPRGARARALREAQTRSDADVVLGSSDELVPPTSAGPGKKAKTLSESLQALTKKYPKLFKNLGRAAQGAAMAGSALQGANIGGLGFQSQRGMVSQEEIAAELGRELGITGLAAAGALAGSFLGPAGTVAGGLGGAGIGIADQLLGTDMTGTAGKYWDKKSGGAMSGGFQKSMENPAFSAWGNMLGGSGFAQTGFGQTLANVELPTWLGGVDYGARTPGTAPTAAPPTGAPSAARAAVAPSTMVARQPLGQGMPPMHFVGTGMEAAKAQGAMYLPSAFAPGPAKGAGAPKAAGASGAGGPYRPFEGTRFAMDEAGAVKGVIQALSRGARVFRPTEAGAGVRAGAPGAPQQYLQNIQDARTRAAGHYGGASNAALVNDANAASALGVPGVSASDSTLSPTGGTQPRGTAEIVEREDTARTAGRATTGEATRVLAEALENIGVQLSSLSKAGLKLPPDFTQTMTQANAAIIEKLGDVGVTSLPSDITVGLTEGTISSLSTAIGISTAGAATGAQQLAESIGELKSELLGERGLVKQKITESVEDFEKRMTQVEDETSELEARITISTERITSITNETLPTITASISQSNDKAEKTKLKIDNMANVAIPKINTKLESVKKVAERADRKAANAKRP